MKIIQIALVFLSLLVLSGCESNPNVSRPNDYSPPPQHTYPNSSPSVLAGKMIKSSDVI